MPAFAGISLSRRTATSTATGRLSRAGSLNVRVSWRIAHLLAVNYATVTSAESETRMAIPRFMFVPRRTPRDVESSAVRRPLYMSEYIQWAYDVVSQVRGVSPGLERRAAAETLQRDPSALIAELSTTGTTDVCTQPQSIWLGAHECSDLSSAGSRNPSGQSDKFSTSVHGHTNRRRQAVE